MQRVALARQDISGVDSSNRTRPSRLGQTTCYADVAVEQGKMKLQTLFYHSEDLRNPHVYPLHDDHTEARRQKRYCLGESNGGAADTCEQRWFLQAKGAVPAFLEPGSIGHVERVSSVLADVAYVGARGLVERVRVDLVNGNSIAVEAIFDGRRNRMDARAWDSTNKAKADPVWKRNGGANNGLHLGGYRLRFLGQLPSSGA